MEHVKNGGRSGKVGGVAGSLLGIKPIITLKQGEIFPSGVGRSRRKTVEKTIELLLNYIKEENIESLDAYSIAVGYGYDYKEAALYKEKLVQALNKAVKAEDIPIRQIGATIGVHTGPYPLGIGIIEKA